MRISRAVKRRPRLQPMRVRIKSYGPRRAGGCRASERMGSNVSAVARFRGLKGKRMYVIFNNEDGLYLESADAGTFCVSARDAERFDDEDMDGLGEIARRFSPAPALEYEEI